MAIRDQYMADLARQQQLRAQQAALAQAHGAQPGPVGPIPGLQGALGQHELAAQGVRFGGPQNGRPVVPQPPTYYGPLPPHAQAGPGVQQGYGNAVRSVGLENASSRLADALSPRRRPARYSRPF